MNTPFIPSSPAPDSLIDTILSHPSASNWLKKAIISLLERDPVDAVNDAEVLSSIFQARLNLLESEYAASRRAR